MSLSVRIKDRLIGKPVAYAFLHDLRLYSPEELPSYINPERTHENRILVALKDLPKSKEDINSFIEVLEQENRQLFQELKSAGKIPKNVGYRIKRPFVSGILTLSHEAQKKLREEKLLDKFLEHAREYLDLLAKALGTDLLYAVVHLDETAPHIHFALRNLVYKSPDPNALKELGWEDLSDTLEKAQGKAISFLFFGDTGLRRLSKREHQIHFSRLQDTLEFFRPLGFGRGTPKKERLARGEPYWKVINRSVKRLHEDLPKEIKLVEEELRRLYYEIGELERRHDELLEEVRRLEERKAKLQEVERRWEEATAKVYELEKEKAKLMQEIVVMQTGIKALEETYSEWQRKNEELAKELRGAEERLRELNEAIQKAEKEVQELKYTLRGYEAMIRDKKREYEELSKQIEEKRKILETLTGAVVDYEEIQELSKRLKEDKEMLRNLEEMARKKKEKLQRELGDEGPHLGR